MCCARQDDAVGNFSAECDYPAMNVVVAHGKASWMKEVLEKMEASTLSQT
jgi:hypothetical protein